ncbi:CO dehydrogenase/acetyl-CoA synthase delta subunit, TIM barrel [Ammonifex degensii KC4]|uniref:CO dehydrogenase/acetyl-CoA synthase delta subunit, TIM barrel n=1 Tax=Ammonifex degensii (strain DSM 10501 / KC4) TaxID=429009 RepID=C9RB74_AMMDK|nr:acetyl-CoA decarbonylase/synthase complex subunit delta [Ammonifex degensii]ACX51501.1 CO dehydrogenase/acetyl-CoA synthase delta subunit, TIM barrel [Ammonifex degensii KC4]
MTFTVVKERWRGKILETTLGTGPRQVKVGGETTLPFLHFEGEIPNRPVVALEIWDMAPEDWPECLTECYADVLHDPAAWAKLCVEYGADLVALRLNRTHPDRGDASPEEAAAVAQAVAEAIDVPLIVLGCDVEEKDAAVLPEVANALKGKNCLLGLATQENYKTIVAACIANGHNVIATSPLDINLAKQLNILITEMNLEPERIVMDPSIGALGYGIEYAYSIIERMRTGALLGDKMLSQPVIMFVGQEAWKTKEARTPDDPLWGEQKKRAVLWEVVTATTLIHAGGHIAVVRHPESVREIKRHIEIMMQPQQY